MKIHLVDYATPAFYGSREMLHISARNHGINNIFSYGPKDLSKEFKRKNKSILKHPKGAGYWIWKPYIILDALKKIGKDDVLIYSDADQGFVQNAGILAKECVKLGIGLYISPRPAKVWTKRDCFIIMGCDIPEYHEDFLGLGGFSCWMRNELCEKILKEWLHYAQDPRISIRDTPNVLGKPNLRGFRRHSTDQSIITMLALKHKVKRLMPPNIKTTTNFLLFYKSRGIFRKEGKVVTRFGVFNMSQFKKIVARPKLYFDGRQIYLEKANAKSKLWDNPFYKVRTK
jgi:hypothetical protein